MLGVEECIEDGICVGAADIKSDGSVDGAKDGALLRVEEGMKDGKNVGEADLDITIVVSVFAVESFVFETTALFAAAAILNHLFGW